MFCFVEQLCIPDCGEVAKKAEAEAVFKELLASCTSRLARTTLGVRPHEEALFDIIRGSIMNLYKRFCGMSCYPKYNSHDSEYKITLFCILFIYSRYYYTGIKFCPVKGRYLREDQGGEP